MTTKTNFILRNSIKASILLLSTGSLVSGLSAQNELSGFKEAEKIWQNALSQYQYGSSEACFANLELLVPALTGDVTFDRLFGLCAQGAGKNDEALLAFNRILAQQPDNAEIRLERARVLYNLSLFEQSRKEFSWLNSKNPPDAARNIINRYLSAIDRHLPKVRSYTRLKVSTSLGHDDNVNSASVLDEFLGFTLDESSKAVSSNYAGVQLAAEHMFTLSHNSGLKISSSLGSKRYPDADFVDQDLATVGLGYVKLYKQSAVGADILAYRQNVDGDLNGKGGIFKTYYRKQLNRALSISPYIKASVFRFSDKVLSKNVNQYVLGTSLSYKLDAAGDKTIGLDYSYGHDYPVYQDSNYELDFNSLNLNYQHKFSDTLKSSSMLQYSTYDYDKAFFSLAFPKPRNDDALNFSSRVDWKVTDNFKLTPLLGFKDFNSNVDIYTYERWYAELNLSYQWLW